jgi:tight adherence protein B
MTEYRQGTPLSAAMGEMKQRLKIESMTLFVVAMLVCHERGGNLAFALEQICHSLEELQRVERKRESDTASGRLLVAILGAFPFLFLALFYVLDPSGTALVFSTAIGQIVLCVVGVLVFGSVRWASSILKIG